MDEMRVVVSGSRGFADTIAVWNVLSDLLAQHKRVRVIHGGCRGPDTYASDWARTNGQEQVEFKADWEKHGRAAGPMRNQHMIDLGKPNLLVAFWDGRSRGTGGTIRHAIKRGIKVLVVPEAPTQ